MNKDNSCIDIIKLIASIMIFTMHIQGFNDNSNINFIFECLSRWGVPFFFVISSFFLYKNGNINRIKLYKYLKRILLLYILWFIFNIPSIYYYKIYNNNIFNFIKDSLISSTFKGSWFLLGSMFSAIIIYLLSKKFNTKKIMFILLPFYIICVLSSVYGGLIPNNIYKLLKYLNFPLNIFSGLYYFSIGKYLAENYNNYNNIKVSKSIIITIILFICYLIEIYIAKRIGYLKTTDQGLFLGPMSFFLSLSVIKVNYYSKYGKLYRNISTIIYCSQGNILLLSNLICKLLNINLYIIKYIIGIIIMSIVVTIILIIIKKYSNKYIFLNYLT